MKVTRRSRRLLRLQDLLFLVLFLTAMGLLAWLSTRYTYEADWTASGRNTLSVASSALLRELPGEIVITAWARENALLRKRITEIIGRYQRVKPDLRFGFVNPDQEPDRARELDILMDGELVIEYQGRSERVRDLSESGVTNALQRVAREAERRVLFLAGHGERDPAASAAYDLSSWAQQLSQSGVRVERLNLLESSELSVDNALLAIASPRASLLPGEVERVLDFVDEGGNLLWLTDPGPLHGLEPLAGRLGLDIESGVVVDPNVSQVGMMLFGTDDPRVALVASYPPHEITRNFDFNTLFPIAGAITVRDSGGWHVSALLNSLSNTWLERGEVRGTVAYDPGDDLPGPLVLGVALSREIAGEAGEGAGDTRTQRIVVVTDGDFLSNGYIGLGGNLQLGQNIVNWLSGDDRLIDIPARTIPDAALDLSRTAMAVIGFGFLVILPLALLGAGMTMWLRRRRR